ncbi:hypothetical protein NP493_99g02003 [Ridgeia piscesae]|uniref:G-protein coupled receptors family 2 profile 2 domain-containing protein n=1 Tax=Ridgeia piscesae TaxID=27915 RepID=A0AAD9UHI4_RIDPI|nr:hypothetical protein NP493_99g02003 [Ridgeia piscesae]
MNMASYVGCSVSALLCLFSIIMLVYLRTSSQTASIHKNFAVAIVCSQLSFMIGINRFQHKLLCHAFAVCLHYFFLAAFQWLLNAAFNLYIVITYAVHSHGEQTDGGSQYRYYVLGWGQSPATSATCWIAWQHVWLFIGPAIGLCIVTLLVLIFTAKEHYESSYSKNETTNNMILIHSKALWTQTILLSLCWSFAFISVMMHDDIVKLLYALFNILQGAFFLVFYFLLNDEVGTSD